MSGLRGKTGKVCGFSRNGEFRLYIEKIDKAANSLKAYYRDVISAVAIPNSLNGYFSLQITVGIENTKTIIQDAIDCLPSDCRQGI